MGVDPKSSLDDYWSTDVCLVNKFVSTTMSKNLFKDIHRSFHVDDPQSATQTSALDRVNSLLSNMITKSKEFFNLHENISIDEAMIKFHVKHSGVVGAPNKPAKRGYKIYTLADGHTGYIWDFEVYLRTAKREEGLTKRVVETLCKDVTGKHHVIYVDKFYTSIPSTSQSKTKGDHGVGQDTGTTSHTDCLSWLTKGLQALLKMQTQNSRRQSKRNKGWLCRVSDLPP
ncbi:vertnin [Plakobranchus ocellatus]|uniref:Vertnin n=1 Tax=Plakobranchus ocellatus TaxID=259542 RepID=A0AAV4BHY2_9GAST|nr:vertnin [Plakobranchus ocellatus]